MLHINTCLSSRVWILRRDVTTLNKKISQGQWQRTPNPVSEAKADLLTTYATSIAADGFKLYINNGA